MLKKLCTLGAALFLIAACSTEGEMSPKVQAMQEKDKTLSCKDILLEMNEAEFYKKKADKNMGPKLKYVFMPLGYISTYMNAEDAIDSADDRIAYLDKVYDIMDCDNQGAASYNAAAERTPQQAAPRYYYPSAAPAPYYYQQQAYQPRFNPAAYQRQPAQQVQSRQGYEKQASAGYPAY